jgi:mono/diheme cytochrome c family protein
MLLVSGCNALDEPAAQSGSRTIVPTDARPVAAALTAAPISGGTLAISTDGQYAIAADPDRARVSIVDLRDGSVRHVALVAGDEPGRVAVDPLGYAYVALRRSGDVVSIRLADAQLGSRVHACSAPRGLALQGGVSLHVACADGKVVTLDASISEITHAPALTWVRELKLGSDLRDVIVRNDRLLVSTFKQAGLIAIDGANTATQLASAGPFNVQVFETVEETRAGVPVSGSSGLVPRPMASHVAWRSREGANGNVWMLHQGESVEEVDIDHASATPGASPYGGGGGFGCSSSIVSNAVTRVDVLGNVRTVPISSGVLTVDMAVTTRIEGEQLAVVQAGGADPKAPRPQVVFEGEGEGSASAPPSLGRPSFSGINRAFDGSTLPLELVERAGTSEVSIFVETDFADFAAFPGCSISPRQIGVLGQATAVAYSPRGDLLVQSREPALLTWIPSAHVLLSNSGNFEISGEQGTDPTVIVLGGDSVIDTGHELFHRDAGGGIACASCHAEGAEDGHTWTFSGIGVRRTQALHVGLQGTEPFHWNGDESNLSELMKDVFVGRMGGVPQSADRLAGLSQWLFALQPPAAAEHSDSVAASHGKALFESAATGCATCHSGAKFTNNTSADVGTGGKLQVPSLRGVAYRAPFMHNGCASTLEARFDPTCGGAQHGKVAQLTKDDLNDLVVYLKTL